MTKICVDHVSPRHRCQRKEILLLPRYFAILYRVFAATDNLMHQEHVITNNSQKADKIFRK